MCCGTQVHFCPILLGLSYNVCFVCRCCSHAGRAAGASDREAAVGVGQQLRRAVLRVPGLGPTPRHHALRPHLLPPLHHPGYRHRAGTSAALPRQRVFFNFAAMLYEQNRAANISLFLVLLMRVDRNRHVVLSVGMRSRPLSWWSFHLRIRRKRAV